MSNRQLQINRFAAKIVANDLYQLDLNSLEDALKFPVFNGKLTVAEEYVKVPVDHEE